MFLDAVCLLMQDLVGPAGDEETFFSDVFTADRTTCMYRILPFSYPITDQVPAEHLSY